MRSHYSSIKDLEFVWVEHTCTSQPNFEACLLGQGRGGRKRPAARQQRWHSAESWADACMALFFWTFWDNFHHFCHIFSLIKRQMNENFRKTPGGQLILAASAAPMLIGSMMHAVYGYRWSDGQWQSDGYRGLWEWPRLQSIPRFEVLKTTNMLSKRLQSFKDLKFVHSFVMEQRRFPWHIYVSASEFARFPVRSLLDPRQYIPWFTLRTGNLSVPTAGESYDDFLKAHHESSSMNFLQLSWKYLYCQIIFQFL